PRRRSIRICHSVATVSFYHCSASAAVDALSLHDALPIYAGERLVDVGGRRFDPELLAFLDLHLVVDQLVDDLLPALLLSRAEEVDRKSTRLNSSHVSISYAVFCLNKKINDCDRNGCSDTS